MQVFITGTDTNIGKTLLSSWLCLHTGYDYFKPIQTGSLEGTDSEMVSALAASRIHPESHVYKAPLAPALAAPLENQLIDIHTIKLPSALNLIVEGAGGLMVPINHNTLMIDLISFFSIPVILIARSSLGTINHTLLSLEALRARNREVLGVIISGPLNQPNCQAIESYGKCKVLAQLPFLEKITSDTLKSIPLPTDLKHLLRPSS